MKTYEGIANFSRDLAGLIKIRPECVEKSLWKYTPRRIFILFRTNFVANAVKY